jgi:hypothetical protein
VKQSNPAHNSNKQMKHLFLVLLTLAFSVSVYSQVEPDALADVSAGYEFVTSGDVVSPITNDVIIETIYSDNFSYPYYSNRFTNQFKLADMEFNKAFGQAIEALRAGKMVKRVVHNKDTFIFMQVPSEISKDVVPRMTSLPPSVKNEFERRFSDEKLQVSAIYYNDQLAMVNSSNLIVGWAPLPEDVLATDWEILG